ncbi:hypothetical protein Q4610_02850 [Sphingobium sp. HBC34]|uniref:Uncharacterized protein n=1 Tax=Sphingobium cyanobacteriorum TaxID=3063954 RepID=A0ABT8ZHF9_9SPHN|nr:hypothetical protein [Sphingobium sp. HBC34]MDO7833974.1 hypothetical protein [Sphingobium sp. HBC34]
MIRLLMSGLLLAASPAAGLLPDDPVLRTLVEGEAAEAGGDHAMLLDSAQVLKALGASPAEGQEDLAARWTHAANAAGITRSALGFRGRALGPAYRRGSLDAGGSVTMRQIFFAGQRAQILVAPRGNSAKLSIRVQNADGGTLCAKPVGGPQADCAWLPLFTDRYDIVIENGGTTTAAFYLIVR